MRALWRSIGACLGACLLPGCAQPDAAITGSSGSGSATVTGMASESSSGAVSTAPATDATVEPPGTTGSPSTGTSESSSGARESLGFIMAPDGYTPPMECSLWKDDCPRGAKCMPWANDGGNAWNATKCTPLDADPDAVGEDCTVQRSGVSGVDSCEARSMCWDVDGETGVGYCVAFCGGDENNPTCPLPSQACSVGADGVPILCMPACNPLLQDCGDGAGCYSIDTQLVCAPDASGDVGADGDPCPFINGCDPGTMCADPASVADCLDGSGCCTPFCSLTKPSCPHPQEVCLPFFGPDSAPPGKEDYGFCGVEA